MRTEAVQLPADMQEAHGMGDGDPVRGSDGGTEAAETADPREQDLSGDDQGSEETVTKQEEIFKALRDIGSLIAERLGYEQAKNFLCADGERRGRRSGND